MGEPFQRVIQRLALLVCGASAAAAADMGRELELVPEPVLVSLVDDAEWSTCAEEDRLRLLRLLALDPRPGVRCEVATGLAARPLGWRQESETLLRDLARDADPGVRRVAAGALAAALRVMPQLDRPEVLEAWTSSTDERIRLAVARALAVSAGSLGGRTALAALERDPSKAVRDAAARGRIVLGRRGSQRV